MTFLEKIAEFTCSRNEVSPEVAERAQIAVRDTIGCMLAGCREASVEAAVNWATASSGSAQASVVGRKGLRLDVRSAAMINAMSAYACDYDDMCDAGCGHPSMPVLPVALAIAEHLGIGDRRMLNAYIRGVEVSALIGAGFKNSTLSLCWNPTTISGGFGAVAAAAYLLDLTITQTTAAFAMMTCEIGGTKGNYGTPAKDVSAGILCAKAIICAQLAKEGITANPAAFSCSTGIAAAIAPDYDYEAVESALKAKNSIFISPGLIPKPYPCCRSNHNAIDGTLKICKEHQITEDMVDSIICRIDPPSWTLDAYHCPDTPEQGKFSTAYCVAIALLHRKVVLGDFSGSKILEKRVFPLIARTKVVRDDTFQNAHFGNEITLKLKDGKTYTYRGTHAKGEACNPMTEEELRDKFLCCGERYYTKNSVQALFDSLSPGMRIPSVFDMNETLIDIQ